jgi:hypothetical protein
MFFIITCMQLGMLMVTVYVADGLITPLMSVEGFAEAFQ